MPPTAISDKGLSADWCLIKRSERSSLKNIVRVQDYREYIIEYTLAKLAYCVDSVHILFQSHFLFKG